MALTKVDWSTLPKPTDDGKAAHLVGMSMPDITLPATTGADQSIAGLTGFSVLYLYPMTGRPDQDLPDGWDMIPGARGCTPQSCAFRDHFDDLQALGVAAVFGVSTQDTSYQSEAATCLHLPFPLLSDKDGALQAALNLPTQVVEGVTLLKRLTMILRDGVIAKVKYPVFPPDQDAQNVMDWLRQNS